MSLNDDIVHCSGMDGEFIIVIKDGVEWLVSRNHAEIWYLNQIWNMPESKIDR